jgi:tetratricopeptide (TPR) repeat protein
MREFDRALADSDREVELRPDHAPAYEERAYLRHRAGDLAGAYADRVRAAALKPGDADALLSRAHAALWLGRFEEASKDTAEALRLARAAGDAKLAKSAEDQVREIALWTERSPGGDPKALCEAALESGQVDRPRLIGDCTAAFLAASTPAQKAEMLTVRALAWYVGQQDPQTGTRDQEVAVGLDPGNHQWRANLGGSYVRARHSWAGRRELDRSIAIKETWVALAQRASARYNLKEFDGAFEDAKRSFEIEPNELAMIVLGDLFNDRGDAKSAKLYWMAAYKMGSRDDGTIARLKSIGIDDPERESRGK